MGWLLRGFFGTYYQAPPLSTVQGPLLEFAVTEGLGFIPLKGERDQENQVGLTIPLRGWSFDVNNFRMRAHDFFDHNSIGDSNVFFPLSIDGRADLGNRGHRSLAAHFRRGDVSLAYSYQHAEAEGAVAGGLTDFQPPEDGYFLLDHDQTAHAACELRRRAAVADIGVRRIVLRLGFRGRRDRDSASSRHTTFNLSLGKIAER